MKKSSYKRIVIKISGEALKSSNQCICPKKISSLVKSVKQVQSLGIELALVIGGGNILRGVEVHQEQGIDRTTADYMGMLATCINALALKDIFTAENIPTRVLSAISMQQITEPYIRGRAISHLKKGRIVIFSAGTGNPYFSTDTTAVLRANEVNADIILKATKVNGIYDKDPHKYPDAKKFSHLTYQEVLSKRLSVMDQTAFTLCVENRLPIAVFNVKEESVLEKILTKDFSCCTIVQ